MVNKRVIVVSILLLLAGRSSLHSEPHLHLMSSIMCLHLPHCCHSRCSVSFSNMASNTPLVLSLYARRPSPDAMPAHTLLLGCSLGVCLHLLLGCSIGVCYDFKAEHLKASQSETSNGNVVALYTGNS
jgi:hypothetical protein